ncbi:mitochondrial import inner membrane translocase subunit TIM10 [Mercurialis annua]|uniref:mitochondrial import inner membrane translocase subunit TIM10 n=1 Tax=Mercurialis annua TaxID=3986 RepID=UPI00215DDDFE|nr:mitochondrial import inner membrane translocase subunit TIM10 [Mercurialis annua]
MAANNGIPAGLDKEQVMGMLGMEMEYKVELFNRLAMTCFNKCVDKKYREPELNMGENSCIDRCVSKYHLVNSIIGQMLSNGQRPT